MWFNRQQRELNRLQSELKSIQLNKQIENAQQQLVAAKDKSTFCPPTVNVQESLATNMLASVSLEKVFMGAVALWEIPAMIRNQWPYKQILIQTIVQLDFVRWVGRVLYSDCPIFSTMIEAMAAQVLGSSGFTYTAFSKDDEQNEDEIEELNEAIEDIIEYNDIHSWEKEAFLRYHREGEVFINVQQSTRSIDDKCPEIRVIEPDYIRPSIKKRQSQEDPNVSMITPGEDWSFGIHNKPFKWYNPEKYNVLWPPDFNKEDVIDAEDMFHIANKEARNQKRGIPTSFRITEDMINATLLRQADAQSAVRRARITGIIEYETNIDNSYVQTDLHELAKTDRDTHPESELYSIATLGLNTQESNWIGVIKGRTFKEFPALDTASSAENYKRLLSTITAYYGLPLATSGLSNEQSFASSLIEETIPTRRREAEQGDWCNYFKKIMKRCLELYYGEVDWGRIDITVKGPSVVIRDEKTQVESHQMKLDAKLESRETAQSDLGLDPEVEDIKIEEDPIAAEMEAQEQEQMQMESQSEPQSDSGKRQKLEGDRESSTKG